MLGYLTSIDNDVFDQLERMRRQMDQMFGGRGGPMGIRSVAAGTYPAINVGASAEQVDVYVFAAGMDSTDLDITLEQNLLTISGERKVEPPEEAEIYRRERFSGAFRRVITLPEDVDAENVTAAYDDGVLHIAVQRREVVKPRKIDVK